MNESQDLDANHESHEEVIEPKKIMSHAERRKLKKAPVVVTQEVKNNAREKIRSQRKYLRLLKSNGARRKLRKMDRAKRERAEEPIEDGDSKVYSQRTKVRRLE